MCIAPAWTRLEASCAVVFPYVCIGSTETTMQCTETIQCMCEAINRSPTIYIWSNWFWNELTTFETGRLVLKWVKVWELGCNLLQLGEPERAPLYSELSGSGCYTLYTCAHTECKMRNWLPPWVIVYKINVRLVDSGVLLPRYLTWWPLHFIWITRRGGGGGTPDTTAPVHNYSM